MLLYPNDKKQRQNMNSLDKLSEKIKAFRHAHDEINAKNQELEEKIKAMSQEIESLKLDLEQKDEEIESIIAKIEELLE
jgi:chromosome segregation ATPase